MLTILCLVSSIVPGVQGPPQITLQPISSALAVPGSSLLLQFNFTSSIFEGSVSISWFRQSVPGPLSIGVDASFLLQGIKAGDGDNYYATVTNTIGSTQTSPTLVQVMSESDFFVDDQLKTNEPWC